MDKNFLLEGSMQLNLNVAYDGETITVDYGHNGVIESVITKVGSKDVFNFLEELNKCIGLLKKENECSEEPTQVLNCKFLCLAERLSPINGANLFTYGKIYEVKDGYVVSDDFSVFPFLGGPLKDIDDLKSYFCWDGYESRDSWHTGTFCGRKINFVPLSSEYKTIIKKFEKSDENTTVFQTFSPENSGLNTKFICLEDGIPNFTAGKIYTVANGKFLDDKKDVLYPIGFCLKNITDLKDYLGFAIEELKLGYKYE